MSLQKFEEKYQDGKVDVVGYKKRISYKLEQRLQRGVGVGESRCESPGFFQGLLPIHSVFASTDPDIWGEENFDPFGRPYDGGYDPPTNDAVEIECDLHGNIVNGEWSQDDDRLLEEELSEEECRIEMMVEEFFEKVKEEESRKRKGKRKSKQRSRRNIHKFAQAVEVVF